MRPMNTDITSSCVPVRERWAHRQGQRRKAATRRSTATSLRTCRAQARSTRNKGLIGQLILILLVVAYASMLHWFYENQVAPLFGYLGQRYRQPDVFSYSLGLVAATVIALFLPRCIRRP